MLYFSCYAAARPLVTLFPPSRISVKGEEVLERSAEADEGVAAECPLAPPEVTPEVPVAE